jgi:hypothetical protein
VRWSILRLVVPLCLTLLARASVAEAHLPKDSSLPLPTQSIFTSTPFRGRSRSR